MVSSLNRKELFPYFMEKSKERVPHVTSDHNGWTRQRVRGTWQTTATVFSLLPSLSVATHLFFPFSHLLPAITVLCLLPFAPHFNATRGGADWGSGNRSDSKHPGLLRFRCLVPLTKAAVSAQRWTWLRNRIEIQDSALASAPLWQSRLWIWVTLIPQWQTHLRRGTPETRPGNICAGGRELNPPCFSQSLRFSLTTRISPNTKNSVLYLPGQLSQNITWESVPGLSFQDSFL